MKEKVNQNLLGMKTRKWAVGQLCEVLDHIIQTRLHIYIRAKVLRTTGYNHFMILSFSKILQHNFIKQFLLEVKNLGKFRQTKNIYNYSNYINIYSKTLKHKHF